MKKCNYTKSLWALTLLVGGLPLSGQAQDKGNIGKAGTTNMLRRQSQNEGILAVPMRGPVSIDGDLRDWDFSGRIWAFADKGIRERFSVQAAAMWDKDNLYLAAKWKDATPMYNVVNPEFDPNDGWKYDAWQLRFKTDQTTHLTTWFYSPKAMPVMHVSHEPAGDKGEALFKDKGPDLGHGVQMAFRKDADGKGYVQEIKIPWTLLYAKVPDVNAGMTLRLGNEWLWGPAAGMSGAIHRYADNMQPGVTSREFYWTNFNAWGDVKLVAQNNLPLRQYIEKSEQLQGTIPIRVTIPATARRFTLAINDGKGVRVRNLAGDFAAEDYSVEVKGAGRVVEVKWDGLNDAGKPVAAGRYRVAGLSHGGLGARYEMSFYNPGTPPWQTKDGSGAWGSDHVPAARVASGGDGWIFVGYDGAEGGSGLFGIGPDGKKKWGEVRGALALAADDKYVYAISSGWYGSGNLIRLEKTTGAYKPFVLDGKERPFELSLSAILSAAAPSVDATTSAAQQIGQTGSLSNSPDSGVTALAARDGQLVMALFDTKANAGKLALLDVVSAKPIKIVDVPHPTALALGRDKKLYAILNGKIHTVDMARGAVTPLAITPVARAVAITVDNDGNLAVVDGADSQVKVFRIGANNSATLLYTAGKKGGRPRRGAFDAQAMMLPTSVAVDAKGLLWVTEKWENPRRVSVWGRDGKLVRDYIGNARYAGSGTYLHDTDPTLAYYGPIEMKLDRERGTYRVTRVLWVPDESKDEAFPLLPHAPHWFSNPSFITSSASGKARRYLFFYDGYNALYMERGDSYAPVAVLCHVTDLPLSLQKGVFADLKPEDGLFWNDLNGDARVQRAEATVVVGGLPLSRSRTTDWGRRPGSDLSIYTNGGEKEGIPTSIMRYKPLRFTPDGAPIYGLAGMTPLGVNDAGDLVPVTEENLLLNLSFKDYPAASTGMMGIDTRNGKVLWTYPNPYPSVHGSHNAPMSRAGLLTGPLKILGVAQVNPQVGRVFALRGNLGQDFFMTTDGLYVGALFGDARLPGEAMPATAASMKGHDMSSFTEGQEPFNGWFGKQSDGVTRMTTGMVSQAGTILRIDGLDTIRRFTEQPLNVDAALLARAQQANAARVAAESGATGYTIRRLAQAPTVDGQGTEWADVAALPLEKEGARQRGSVKMGYDAQNLYVLFEVEDATPMLNQGKDYTRLFKTGDAVDVQLSTGKDAATRHNNAQAGDLRIVFSRLNGKPTAVLMKQVDPTSPAAKKVEYSSPVAPLNYDRVEILTDAQVAIHTQGDRYRVEAAIPLAGLGLTPRSGMAIRGDAGFISSDTQGLINVARTYWANQHTNLTQDLPQEAALTPGEWGDLSFE